MSVKKTPPKKRIRRLTTKSRKAIPVVQAIHVAVIETGKVTKKRKVSCFYPDGSHGSGWDAGTHPHMELKMQASRKDQIVWQSLAPFIVELTKGADVFVKPQPWASTLVNGVHRVETGAIVPNHPKLSQGKSVKAKFEVRVSGAESYDPHFVIDP